jgi:hypothetical protein
MECDDGMGEGDNGENNKGEAEEGETEKGETEMGEAGMGEAEMGEAEMREDDDGEEVEGEEEEHGDGKGREYKDMGPEGIEAKPIEEGGVGTGTAGALHLEGATTADTVNLWMGNDTLFAIGGRSGGSSTVNTNGRLTGAAAGIDCERGGGARMAVEEGTIAEEVRVAGARLLPSIRIMR